MDTHTHILTITEKSWVNSGYSMNIIHSDACNLSIISLSFSRNVRSVINFSKSTSSKNGAWYMFYF